MAKKNIPAIVSGMGLGTEILSVLCSEAKAQGLPEEGLHKLATPAGKEFLKKLVGMLVAVAAPVVTAFKVVVDYCRSTEEMVAAGKYDWTNPDINSKNFPKTRHGKEEVAPEVIDFDREMASSEEVIEELGKLNPPRRPANLWEGLAFGEKYPDEQRKGPIVILGSVWQDLDGNRFVAYLSRDGAERVLHLGNWSKRWHSGYRFLAVRK